MEIRICKLVDGSIVIGKLSEEGLAAALELVVQAADGVAQVAIIPIMYPFNQSSEGEYIARSKVMCDIKAPDELVSTYITKISGIIPASGILSKLTKNGLSLVK